MMKWLHNHKSPLVVSVVIVLLLFVAILPTGSLPAMAGPTSGWLADQVEDSIPVLNYHMISPLYDPLSIDPQEFERQMRYLHDNGYQTISPDQLLDHLQFGKQLPKNPIMITFDDGYVDNYSNAAPILKKYGFTATIFVIIDKIDTDPRFMTWEQVQALSRDHFSIQSHTIHHEGLNKLSPDQVWHELYDSRMILEQKLQKPVLYFAYPRGSHSPAVHDMVQKAGYRAAFTICFGETSCESNVYALERVPIFRSSRTFRSFFLRLHGAPLLERFGIIKQ